MSAAKAVAGVIAEGFGAPSKQVLDAVLDAKAGGAIKRLELSKLDTSKYKNVPEQQQFLQEEKRKAMDAQRRIDVDRERIESMEDIADLRDETARARLEQQARLKMLDMQNKN